MAKKKKAKFPKRVAGVKTPKALRRALRPLAEAAGTPFGRALASQAIVSAAGALILKPELRRDIARRGMEVGVRGLALARSAAAAGRGAWEAASHPRPSEAPLRTDGVANAETPPPRKHEGPPKAANESEPEVAKTPPRPQSQTTA